MQENPMHWYMQMQAVGFALIPYGEEQRPREGITYLGFTTRRAAEDRAWEIYEKLYRPPEEGWIGGTD